MPQLSPRSSEAEVSRRAAAAAASSAAGNAAGCRLPGRHPSINHGGTSRPQPHYGRQPPRNDPPAAGPEPESPRAPNHCPEIVQTWRRVTDSAKAQHLPI